MARVEITMPKMGESITEGTVIAWMKKPGDSVETDETLLEIGTDKVDTEIPSIASGVLAEILVPEGETVEVGTLLAVIETEVDAVEQPPPPDEEAPEGGSPEPSSDETPAEEGSEGADVSAAPAEPAAQTDVLMPKMGESIVEGTILHWQKKPGDRVEMDEPLVEVATDKVDTEVPSPVSGVLLRVLAEEGDTVEVGAVIAVIASEAPATVVAAPSKPAPASRAVPEQTEVPGPSVPHDGDAEPVSRMDEGGRFFSPLVRAIAEKENISAGELETLQGTGRDGRITKADLLGYIERRKSGRAPAGQPARPKRPAPEVSPAETDSEGRVEIIEMDRMRQIIAEHMVRSKSTSAHVTSFAEVDVTNLVRVRERNREVFQAREGVPLTYTPFFVRAAVEALHDHPLLNASVEEKRIIVRKDIHIGIAVAIGRTGLLAPVIRRAGEKNLVGLARSAYDLAMRARAKQLQPDELQGGTFTITNIGSLGSIMGTPIINQPQVAILATGAIKKRPVVIEDPRLGDLIVVRHMMYVSLSYDHRIIDGAMGASFLQKFVGALESIDPDTDL